MTSPIVKRKKRIKIICVYNYDDFEKLPDVLPDEDSMKELVKDIIKFTLINRMNEHNTHELLANFDSGVRVSKKGLILRQYSQWHNNVEAFLREFKSYVIPVIYFYNPLEGMCQ
jgi:hypothetical protein